MFCFNSKDSSDVKGSYWRVDRVLLAAGDREETSLRCRRLLFCN